MNGRLLLDPETGELVERTIVIPLPVRWWYSYVSQGNDGGRVATRTRRTVTVWTSPSRLRRMANHAERIEDTTRNPLERRAARKAAAVLRPLTKAHPAPTDT